MPFWLVRSYTPPPSPRVESVQVSVILFWLQDLASEQRRQGRPAEAAAALRKALMYMGGDKGEALTQVSGGGEGQGGGAGTGEREGRGGRHLPCTRGRHWHR